MSDNLTTQPGAEQAPATEEEKFDENWNEFMTSSLGQPEEQDEDQNQDTQVAQSTEVGSGNETLAGAPAGDETVAASPDTTPVVGADGADAVQPDPEVDPADLAAFMGFTGEQTQPAPAAQAGPKGDDAADFMPFQPNFKLPPAITQAIFEAEDAATREQGLVSLLSSFGNVVIKVMEERFAEHHAPRMQSAALTAVNQHQVQSAIVNDFNSNFPELSPYKEALNKAWAIVASKPENVGKPYDENIRNQVGNLARQALAQSGIKLPARAAAKPAAAAPASSTPVKAKAKVFEAGGSRPAGFMDNSQDSGPEALVRDLSEW